MLGSRESCKYPSMAFSARVKSCPFKTSTYSEVSQKAITACLPTPGTHPAIGLPLSHLYRSNQRIECRGLPRAVAGIEWSFPKLSKAVIRSLIVAPDAVGIGIGKSLVLCTRSRPVQPHEIAYEDAFELRQIRTFARRFFEDAGRRHKICHRGARDCLCFEKQCGVVSSIREFDQSSQNDSLVISPRGSVVIGASRGV